MCRFSVYRVSKYNTSSIPMLLARKPRFFCHQFSFSNSKPAGGFTLKGGVLDKPWSQVVVFPSPLRYSTILHFYIFIEHSVRHLHSLSIINDLCQLALARCWRRKAKKKTPCMRDENTQKKTQYAMRGNLR